MNQIEQENREQTVQPVVTGEMSVGQWMITLLISAVPFVNIIMLFVWGFGQPNPRRNYSRATLLFTAICIGLMLIWFIFVGVMIGSAFSSY